MAESDLVMETARETGMKVVNRTTSVDVEEEPQKEFEIVDWFKNKIKESRVTIVVYYRGFWWPPCKVGAAFTTICFIICLLQEHLKEFAQLFEEFKEKDVGVFAVCAEPQDQADNMERELSLPFKVCL